MRPAVVGGADRRYTPGPVLTDMAVLLADGGETIADLAVLRDQFRALPSSSAEVEKSRMGVEGSAL